MYLKIYDNYDAAYAKMRVKNRAHSKGDKQTFVVTEHPEVDGREQWAVMELRSAVDAGFSYDWSAR